MTCRTLIVFETPMLFEVMGAGFQKLPQSQTYELRWPRVQKVYSAEQRPWTAGEAKIVALHRRRPDLACFPLAPDASEYLDLAKSALGHSSGLTAPTPSPVKAIREIWDSSSAAIDYPESVSPFKPRPDAPLEVSINGLPPSPAASRSSTSSHGTLDRPTKRRRLCLVKIRSRPKLRNLVEHFGPPLRVKS